MKLLLSITLLFLLITVEPSFGQGDIIYMQSEKIQTVFPGGKDSLKVYLNSSLRNAMDYAAKKNINGTVYIFFVVEKDGSISNAEVLKGVNGKIDKMVKKSISRMSLWIPANLDGINCRVREGFGIKFTSSGQLELDGYKKY